MTDYWSRKKNGSPLQCVSLFVGRSVGAGLLALASAEKQIKCLLLTPLI